MNKMQILGIGTEEYEVMDSKARIVNSITELKSIINLEAGNVIRTIGYHSANHKGGGYYLIREKLESDIEDNGSIHFINDSLIAELVIINNSITPEQFGCYGDGTHDDTTNLQKALDFVTSHLLAINFIGVYNVNPISRADGTKVCLTIARNGTMFSSPIEFNFIGGAQIKTNSEEICTLLRLNISNTKFNGLFLSGVEGKTNLLELSRIHQLDQNETTMNNRNSFINSKFMQGKDAIILQGGSYYNSFTKYLINDCDRGIVIEPETLEKNGVIASNASNRNDFIDGTMLNLNTAGIRIEYGDTTKFVNTNFEGVNNPIYLDDPQLHKSDFPIEPLYYSYDNMFVNTTYEKTTGIRFYNNIGGTKVINITTDYNKENFPVKPHIFIGGVDDFNSMEKVMTLYKNLQNSKVYDGAISYSMLCDSNNGINAKTFFDFNRNGEDIVPTIRKDSEWVLGDSSNISDITYEDSAKLVVKGMGGLVFLTSKFKVNVTNPDSDIILHFPTDLTWVNQQSNLGKQNKLPPVTIPICVVLGENYTTTLASIYTDRIKIHKPTNGWNAGGYNNISINTHFFRDEINQLY